METRLLITLLTLLIPTFSRGFIFVDVDENAPSTFLKSLSESEFVQKGVSPDKVTVQKSDLFELKPNWDFVTLRPLDREELCPEIDATDKCVLKVMLFSSTPFVTLTLQVEVNDRNDEPPQFPVREKTLTIPENTPPEGAKWVLEVATDRDSLDHGVNLYTLECEDCDADSEGTFGLNMDKRLDGVLLPTLALREILDHESKAWFTLRLTASDSAGNEDSMRLNINVSDVNDNAPIFGPSKLQNTIAEDLPVGSLINQVSATDLDSGRFGEIEYGFSEQASLPETVKHFSIDPVSGEITLIKKLENQGGKQHEVHIFARDKAPSPLTDEMVWTFIISESNDFTPVVNFVGLHSTAIPADCVIPEGGQFKGDVVGYFEVIDEDPREFGDTTFELLSGHEFLEVLDPTAEMKFVRLKKSLDREVTQSITVDVTASDCRDQPAETCPPNRVTKQMELKVCDSNDNSPILEHPNLRFDIDEELPPQLLVTFKADDADIGVNGELKYLIPQTWIHARFFVMNPETGELSSSEPLDRELLGSRVEVPILVTDKGSPPRNTTGSLILRLRDINDNPPRYINGPGRLTLFENSTIDQEFGTIRAVDDDEPSVPIVYSLTSESSPHFDINPTTGQLKSLKVFDYEKSEDREFDVYVIAAEDQPNGLENELHIKVEVLDINDNYPILAPVQSVVTLAWDLREGDPVYQVSATDRDSGPNGRVQYCLQNDYHGRFAIQDQTGLIFMRHRNNAFIDKDQTFILDIQAHDMADEIQRKRSAVTLEVFLSSNLTMYNDTLPGSGLVNLPLNWRAMQGMLVYAAAAAGCLILFIILLWVCLMLTCRKRRDPKRGNQRQFGPSAPPGAEHEMQISQRHQQNRISMASYSDQIQYIRPLDDDVENQGSLFRNPHNEESQINGHIHDNPLASAELFASSPLPKLRMEHMSSSAAGSPVEFSPHPQGYGTMPGGLGSLGGHSRRQMSEPVDLKANYEIRNSQAAAGGGGGGMFHQPVSIRVNTSSSDVTRHSPDQSDSSSFDSGRGSNDCGGPGSGLDGSGGGGGRSAMKTLPSLSKKGVRSGGPQPMFADYKEEDSPWQPRGGGGAAQTLPSKRPAAANPDHPSNQGILITPSRQILQPPASNHEKWNLPRDNNSFKSSASPSPPAAANISLPRMLTELDTIEENFTLDHSREQPDICKEAKMSLERNMAQMNPELPKRNVPSIPIDNESRTAVV